MVFQLNAQIPLTYRGYNYGQSQQNALRGLQMQAAERDIDEQNALATALRGSSDALTSDDPTIRGQAAAALARTGTRGYQLAAPVLEVARQEREFNAIRGRFGGGAAFPSAPDLAMPSPMAPASPVGPVAPGPQTGGPTDIRARNAEAAQMREAVLSDPNLTPEQQAEALARISAWLAAPSAPERPGGYRSPSGVENVYVGAAPPTGVIPATMPGGGGGQAPQGVIPAQAGGGGPPRQPGMPTPQQFAQLAELSGHPNPRIARWAQAQVQTWAPFMRQENPNFQMVEIDGQRVAVDPRNPNNRIVLGRAGNGMQTVGTIPPGFQLERTPEGAIRMVPIPGGPAERQERQAARAEDAQRTGRERTGNIVIQDLDRALASLDTARLPVAGLGAGTAAAIPGTAAADVARLLDSVRANVGFAQLNQMRSESPTGGALGNVTERELAFLQAVLGSLDQSQSPTQFRQNLERVRNVFLDIVHGPGQGPNRRATGIEAPNAGPAGARPNDAAGIPGPGGQGTAMPPPPASGRPPLDAFFRQGR